MISALTANPQILKELFDRLDIGCIIFEPNQESLPFLKEDNGFISIVDLSDQILCSTANKVLKEILSLPEMGSYTLKDWLNDFPDSKEYLRICEANGEISFTKFKPNLGKKGAWVSGEYVIKYDKDGNFQCLIGIFKDVSSEVKLKEKISVSQNKLEFAELILEISQKLARIGTWRFDIKSEELEWTDTLYNIYDIPYGTENLYEVFKSRIHPEDFPIFNSTYENAIQSKSSYTIQHRAIHRNGKVVYLYGNGHPIISAEGEIAGYFGLCQDISNLKTAEIKLEHINKNLEDKVEERTKELELSSQKMKLVVEQLQRQNEQLQQYTYIVSHNLRAPVANLTGLSELFDPQNANSEENQQIIANISRVSRQLDQIIIDLNEVLSSDGQIESVLTEVNLSYEIQRVCEELQDQIMKSGAQIDIKVPNQFSLKGVRAYVFSILHNLLDNALKYKLADVDLTIEIGACVIDNNYCFWVKDNGIGMDLTKDQDRLFQLHARIHDTGVQGMGMGLFLVKSHTEQMGGKVKVESEPNKGSCFKILLPL